MTLLLSGAHKTRDEANFSLDSETKGANSLSPTAAASAPTPSNNNYPSVHSKSSFACRTLKTRMNSEQTFKLIPITSLNSEDVSTENILSTIREIVEKSPLDVSIKAIESKLRKQYGKYISISTATSSSGKIIFMYIIGIDGPTSSIRLYIRMINPPSLVNQSLRRIRMALNNESGIQTLEIPNRFKEILINSDNFLINL